MSQSRDGLHLNGVPLLKGVVQYPRGVYHLVPHKAAEHDFISHV